MRSIIVGCGRVGAGFAERLAEAGHEVTVIDISTEAFDRLNPGFPGQALRGDGSDEDTLRRVGAEGSDYFFALTEGDNRNILAAQLAMESFGIPHVVAKINDPVRAEAYTQMGISTICRTTRLIDALGRFTGLPPEPGADGVHVAVPHRHDADGRARPADAMELDGRPGDDRRPEADGRTGGEDRTGAEGRSGEG